MTKKIGDSTDEKALLWKQKGEKKTVLLDPKSLGNSTGEKKTDTKKNSIQRVLEAATVFQILCIYLSTTYLCLAIT